MNISPQDSTLRPRLRLIWEDLFAVLDWPAPALEPLLDAYAGPGRAYHGLEHLAEVLEWSRRVPLEDRQRALIGVALFYHDAVYQPRRSDNERRSADWAGAELAGAPWRGQVESLIMDTLHQAEPADELGRWLVDIDLSVLGAEAERFERYDRDVRREYGWVPWFLYRRRRRQILQSFLDRPHIYATEFFRERLEQAARRNLAGALAKLG